MFALTHSKANRSGKLSLYSIWKKISLCCLLHFQDFLENLAACHNVFLESYFSIFSEMFPFSGLCTRCAIFCAFFSCCCFAAQVNRATRCCSSAFCIDQSQHQQSDWVLKCASVALVNCTSRWSLYLALQCIAGSLCWSFSYWWMRQDDSNRDRAMYKSCTHSIDRSSSRLVPSDLQTLPALFILQT